MTDNPSAGAPGAATDGAAKVSGTPGVTAPPDTQTPGDTAPPDNQGAGDRKRSKGGFQRKIERAEQERDFWKEEALKSRPAKPDNTPEPQEADEKPPSQDDFDSFDEYLRADARYHAKEAAEKALSARDEKQRNADLKKARDGQISAYRDRMSKAKEKIGDFEQVVSESDAEINDAMRDALVESEQGPEILYYLAKNPDKASAMTQMGLTALNREIGRIEALLETQAQDPNPASPSQNDRKATKAAAPFSPVNSGQSNDGLAYRRDMTQSQYEAMRKRQIAAKGGGR